jgi:excisionase family DNA binding protein
MAQPTNKTQPPAHAPAIHLVDIATVADYLGVNVRYVRRLVADREIPYIKWRHLLRFDLAVIARWVDQSRYGEERLVDRRQTARP